MGSDAKLLVREGEAWDELDPALDAATVSTERRAQVVDWSIHTAVDQVWIRAYENGALVRELRYASGEGWTKHGKAQPYENTPELGTWLRKKPPPLVADPGATFSLTCSPVHAAELRAIADRAGVTVSAVVETAWHLAKRSIYDEQMKRVTKLGLDLTMLVDDTSPPAEVELPAFAHDQAHVSPIDLTREQFKAIPHELALSAWMLAELERISTMFDQSKVRLLDTAYERARARLV